MKIKQGDTVMVLSGKDKGKTGTVTKTIKKHDAVIVDGVNMVTKHQKPARRGSQGQLIQKAAQLPIGKVGLVVDGKPVRVGYSTTGEGDKRKKVRVARPSGKTI
jgi:large subunit ribosomal protein L24